MQTLYKLKLLFVESCVVSRFSLANSKKDFVLRQKGYSSIVIVLGKKHGRRNRGTQRRVSSTFQRPKQSAPLCVNWLPSLKTFKIS